MKKKSNMFSKKMQRPLSQLCTNLLAQSAKFHIKQIIVKGKIPSNLEKKTFVY